MICFENPQRCDDCTLHMIGKDLHDVKKINDLCHAKYHKIIVVTDGKIRANSLDVSVTLGKGDVYLSFPFDALTLECVDNGPVEYGCIGFAVNSKRFGDAFNKIWSEIVSGARRVFASDKVLEIVNSVYDEISNKSEAFSKEIVSLLCSQLVIHVVREFDNHDNAELSTNIGNAGLCELIMNYIDLHLYEIKSLADMAAKFGYNYSYLSTTFHRVTNITLNSYYKTKRMDAARVLLTEEKMTISKVAERLNYSSVYAFSKAFKEFYGISPGHYSGRYENK